MTPNIFLCSSLRPLSQAVTVTFGNGSTGEETHAGSVLLETQVLGRPVSLTLTLT
jgi:hypothetical protein